MKKIFYLVLFVLCAFLLVGCDETSGRTFQLKATSATPLREKIEFVLVLNDPDKQLGKSAIKGTISEKGSKTVKQTKTPSFTESNEYTDTVSFTGLEPATTYSVEFYASYNGKKITLISGDYTTLNEGTAENPYKISSYEQFDTYVRNERDGHFELTCDIDFKGKSIKPLFQTAFTGTFNGNNFTIKNFTLATKVEAENDDVELTHSASRDQYNGLFGIIGSGAKVYDFKLENFQIYVSRDSARNTGTYAETRYYYGVLAGECSGEISNVDIVKGITENNEEVISTLNVKCENKNKQVFKVGGLVGRLANEGTIKDCEITLDINVEGAKDVSVGGIAGTTRGTSQVKETVEGIETIVPNISNTNFTGNINVSINGTTSEESHLAIGGLVGKNAASYISECDADVAISLVSKFTENDGQSIFVGGLVGKNMSDNSKVDNCTATASFDVETKDVPTEDNKINIYIGMFAGRNGGDDVETKSVISNCTFVSKGENKLCVADNGNVTHNFDVVGSTMVGTKVENPTLPTVTPGISVEKYVPTEEPDTNEGTEEELQ